MFFLSISEVDKPVLIMQLYSLYLHINSSPENGLPQKFRSSTRSFLMENRNTEFRNEQITFKPVQSKKRNRTAYQNLALQCGFFGALKGTRTPGLLIRSAISYIHRFFKNHRFYDNFILYSKK